MAETKTASYSEKVLDFIEISGSIMEKTAAMVQTKEAQDTQINKLIPTAVQALLENERIEPHEKEAAEKVLQDPVKVMEILIKTAAHRNDSERSRLGTPEPTGNGQTKQANYNSLTDGYVGRRSAPGESESDKAFRRGLGL